MPKSAEVPEDLEAALARLDAVVRELEAGGLRLDATFERYEEGVALVRVCRERLANVERRVEELLADGQVRRLRLG